MGAQYRFERQTALDLYRASKALAANQIELERHFSESFTPLNHFPHDTLSQFPMAQLENGPKDELGMIQALTLLMIFSTYNHHSLLPDAFQISNYLFHYLRERIIPENDDESTQDWEQWIQLECRRRTLFGSFIFIHIQSVVYNIPPNLMSSEMHSVRVPSSETLWNAEDGIAWRAIKENSPPGATFGETHAALLESCQRPSITSNISSFANLALIHVVLQKIYLAWELNATSPSYDRSEDISSRHLPSQTISRLACALQQWKINWEATTKSYIDPISSSGSLGFNSTALFRIACIRLYYNLGPYLKFKTRNPWVITQTIRKAPLPSRKPELYNAVLQSAQSLSIPVRLGIEYVARTQTLTWSIVHTLCNVECALFLTKWLEMMAAYTDEMCVEEQRLIDILKSILKETEFKIFLQSEGDRVTQIQHVSIGIVKLLAQTIKGSHVFELAETLQASLEIYAATLADGI